MKRHIGKIIGVIIAFVFGFGILGGIVLFILGHLFDRARLRNPYSDSDEAQLDRQHLFFITTFQVMGHISKAKGVITEKDIEVANSIMDRFDLYDDQRQFAQEAFREGKDPNFPLRKAMRRLRLRLGRRFDLIKIFLEIQLQVALADGNLHPKEKEVLLIIASELGIARQFETILNMIQAGHHFGQQNATGGGYEYSGFSDPHTKIKEAYVVLGLPEGSDTTAIKRAYKKLMNEHHPDKLIAKGLPPEMMELAKEKTQAIQSAYELLKTHHGFK